MEIEYRTFRNDDPPQLVRLWNESLTGRGAAFLQGVTPLEYHVLAKPYFDPEGLILAAAGDEAIGFAHAGFGPDEDGQRLSTRDGVVCMVVVHPKHRRCGVGAGLLRRAEDYLRRRGAESIFCGAIRPLNPFYWGIYGGSELPGILASDADAEPFLLKNGYVVWDRTLVMHRSLDRPPSAPDPRFSVLRRNFELGVAPRPIGRRWFDACVLAQLEMLQFQLKENASGHAVAEATVWDMDLFGWRWHQPAAGIFDLRVEEDYRRQGLAKFLLVQILQYLQDQFFTLVEVQTMEKNTLARQLYLGLGFQTVDEGRVYKKAASS